MSKLVKLQKALLNFRSDRDWQQFHTPRTLSTSIVLESSELLEHFQWLKDEEIQSYVQNNKTEVSEEMADIFNYLLIMAHDLDIDLIDASLQKIEKNEKKYPIEKSKGVSTKYTKLTK